LQRGPSAALAVECLQRSSLATDFISYVAKENFLISTHSGCIRFWTRTTAIRFACARLPRAQTFKRYACFLHSAAKGRLRHFYGAVRFRNDARNVVRKNHGRFINEDRNFQVISGETAGVLPPRG